MKIKRAPVSDLIAYFIELYNKDITGTEHTFIPDIISSYYQKIAGSRIPIYEKILIEDWCFSSWGEIEDMPWTEGVLVKNKNGDFGITCYTGARDMGRANMMNMICFMYISLTTIFFRGNTSIPKTGNLMVL